MYNTVTIVDNTGIVYLKFARRVDLKRSYKKKTKQNGEYGREVERCIH